LTRYLVTGCAGFIGSHLIEELLAAGHEVVGIDAFTDYYDRSVKEWNVANAREHSRFRLIETDLSEAALDPLLAGVDGIFHLAAQPGVRGSWGSSFATYVRDNIIATQRLFEASAEAGLRVVFASSSSVYGEAEEYPTGEDAPRRPISPYGVTKLSCEDLHAAYWRIRGLEAVTLRYFTVYGPRQRPDMALARLVNALFEGRAFRVFGTGEQSRDFTYVGDAVAATVLAMETAPAGAVYNVSGGAEATLADVISTLERTSGRSLDLVYDAAAPGDVLRTAADTSHIRAELGWTPVVPLTDGLRAQWESVESVRVRSSVTPRGFGREH
jgi:UDP-glucuronate 4-epimerase